jgi:hypothetical protein
MSFPRRRESRGARGLDCRVKPDNDSNMHFLFLTPFNPPLLEGEREEKERGANAPLKHPGSYILAEELALDEKVNILACYYTKSVSH